MNTARLARKWTEAHGDYGRMAEALGEEIEDPAAGLVTRDYLDVRFAEFEKRLAEFEARFTWKIVGLLGAQIVIFSLIIKYL
jgi:hypothetical protein